LVLYKCVKFFQQNRKELLLAISYAGLAGTLINPLIGGLAYHATGQLKILKNDLQHLGDQTELEVTKNYNADDLTKCKILYKKIQQCIVHHNAILV
jgi:hypothetical protein